MGGITIEFIMYAPDVLCMHLLVHARDNVYVSSSLPPSSLPPQTWPWAGPIAVRTLSPCIYPSQIQDTLTAVMCLCKQSCVYFCFHFLLTDKIRIHLVHHTRFLAAQLASFSNFCTAVPGQDIWYICICDTNPISISKRYIKGQEIEDWVKWFYCLDHSCYWSCPY